MKFKKSKYSVLLGMMLVFSACNKNGDSGNSNSAPAPAPTISCSDPQSCAGLTTNAGLLFSGQAVSAGFNTSLEFALDVMGDNRQFNATDVKAIIKYSGPAALVGYLRISGANSSGLCGAPNGDYNLQMVKAGALSSGILRDGTMVGVGPNGVRLELRIFSATAYNTDVTSGTVMSNPYNRYYLQLRVETVNGRTCGANIIAS